MRYLQVIKHLLIYCNKTWGDVIYGQHLNQMAAQNPDRLTVVQPCQPERIVDLELGECFLIGEFLDDPVKFIINGLLNNK